MKSLYMCHRGRDFCKFYLLFKISLMVFERQWVCWMEWFYFLFSWARRAHTCVIVIMTLTNFKNILDFIQGICYTTVMFFRVYMGANRSYMRYRYHGIAHAMYVWDSFTIGFFLNCPPMWQWFIFFYRAVDVLAIQIKWAIFKRGANL